MKINQNVDISNKDNIYLINCKLPLQVIKPESEISKINKNDINTLLINYILLTKNGSEISEGNNDSINILLNEDSIYNIIYLIDINTNNIYGKVLQILPFNSSENVNDDNRKLEMKNEVIKSYCIYYFYYYKNRYVKFKM